MVLDRGSSTGPRWTASCCWGRAELAAGEAVRRLAGLHAQDPFIAYLSLWARLEGFAKDDLARLLEGRRVGRSSLLRGTQHVLDAADFLWLRPSLEPVLERLRRAGFGRRTARLDQAELAWSAQFLLPLV